MSDPKVEERARELLKPHSFRVTQRRQDLGGIAVTSSVVDYWEAVHVVDDLLARLDETERDAQRVEDQANNLAGDVMQLEQQLAAAEERERVLIAGVKEIEAWSTDWARDFRRPARLALIAILSRLLPSTPTECQHPVTQNKFGGATICADCSVIVGYWKEPQPRLSMTKGSTPTEEGNSHE